MGVYIPPITVKLRFKFGVCLPGPVFGRECSKLARLREVMVYIFDGNNYTVGTHRLKQQSANSNW